MQKLTISLIFLLIVTVFSVNDVSFLNSTIILNILKRKFAQITDGMRCKLCQDVIKNEAKWAELEKVEEVIKRYYPLNDLFL